MRNGPVVLSARGGLPAAPSEFRHGLQSAHRNGFHHVNRIDRRANPRAALDSTGLRAGLPALAQPLWLPQVGCRRWFRPNPSPEGHPRTCRRPWGPEFLELWRRARVPRHPRLRTPRHHRTRPRSIRRRLHRRHPRGPSPRWPDQSRQIRWVGAAARQAAWNALCQIHWQTAPPPGIPTGHLPHLWHGLYSYQKTIGKGSRMQEEQPRLTSRSHR